MGLLGEIQSSLMDGCGSIGPILLKLRFLASRLGSVQLEEWVKHESEGYPAEVKIPDYRKVSVSYTASFNGPFGSGISNAPIPPYLIETHCGDSWTTMHVRQSVASIDQLISPDSDRGTLQIDASNLILLLQGKVYKGYACHSVCGLISKASLADIQNAVRARALELTLEIEKRFPEAAEIAIGSNAMSGSESNKEAINRITNNVIHGNYTSISNNGTQSNVTISVNSHDTKSFANALELAGISKSDAEELSSLVASEEPESATEPFGNKAKHWISKNIGKAADGTWKIGIAAATKVLTEAALQYYNLK